MTWDPGQYLRFADRRLRPALELLARVPGDAPRYVIDLGCGAGNVTVHLRQRWPDARIVAVDSSPEMLDRARNDHADLDVEWVLGDAATWEPDGKVDVAYSNALLHWLDDHEALFPRLVGQLAEGGTLAVQMPRNHARPSHTCALEAVAAGPWAATLASLVRPEPVAEPATYHRILAPHAASVDVWETDYLQVFSGPDEIAEWTRGSLLRPLLAALGDDDASAFEADYRGRIRAAYPAEVDGRVVFPFRRLFVVATR